MFTHPFFKAFGAQAYIIGIAVVLDKLPLIFGSDGEPDSPLVPAAIMLSLLVLSVASMIYFFFSSPLILVRDGKYQEALSYFGQTLLYFGALVAVTITSFVLLV